MKYRVIVDRPVVALIGEHGLSRNAVVRLYAQLHQELVNEAERFRATRHPEEPDLFFHYRIQVASGDHWHQFDFAVNDTTASGTLFVEAVSHTSWPW
jgi:pyridoxine/pyridoxamine 5'-phosphate oxidase